MRSLSTEAVNIPFGKVGALLGELLRDREILATCQSGQRAYLEMSVPLQKEVYTHVATCC
jgi:rhodanese-related sulfurtransferase